MTTYAVQAFDIDKAIQVCRDLRQCMVDGAAAEYTDSGRVGEALADASKIMPKLRDLVLDKKEAVQVFSLDDSIAPNHKLLGEVIAEMTVVDAMSILAEGFSWEDIETLNDRVAAALGSLGINPAKPDAEVEKDVFFITSFDRKEVMLACRMLQEAYNHGARNNATMDSEDVTKALEKALAAYPGLEDLLSTYDNPTDVKVDVAFVAPKNRVVAKAGGILGIISADSEASQGVDWDKVDEGWGYAKKVLKQEGFSLRKPMAPAKSAASAPQA